MDENPCAALPAAGLSPLRGMPSPTGLEHFQAGLLVLIGAAREHRSIGRIDADQQLKEYAQLISEHVLRGGSSPAQIQALSYAHETIAANSSQGIDWDRLLTPEDKAERAVRELVEAVRTNSDDTEYLIDQMLTMVCQTPDVARRAEILEHRLEASEFIQGMWESLGRELCRKLGREQSSSGTHDLRMAIETVQGEKLAADLRRDEMAAFGLGLLEHLKVVRPADLPSDLELIHHSVVASPRTRESEAAARAYIEKWADRSSVKRAVDLQETLNDMANRVSARDRELEQVREVHRTLRIEQNRRPSSLRVFLLGAGTTLVLCGLASLAAAYLV